MPQDIELWTHEKSGRQFLIPLSLKLPPGEYKITNRARETIGVQKAHIKGFRAKEEEVEAFMQAEIQEALVQVGEVFKGLFDVGKKALGNVNITEMLQQFIDEDDDSSDDDDSSWDSEMEDSSDESDSDSAFPDNVFVFEGPSEEDSESEIDLDDIEGEFDQIFKEFVEGVKEPFDDLKKTVVGGLNDLQEAFGELGTELRNAATSDEGRTLLRELGKRLQDMADGLNDEDSESSSDGEAGGYQEPLEEDSVEVIEPEEWVEQLVEEIKEKTETPTTEVQQKDEKDVDIPSKTALKRLKKSELIEMAGKLGLDIDENDTKAIILNAIEAAR